MPLNYKSNIGVLAEVLYMNILYLFIWLVFFYY
jgi:hypothetical protein